jgi:RNA polymerase sigma-70 factor (ECF subfamily)
MGHLVAEDECRHFHVTSVEEVIDLVSIAREPLVRYVLRFTGGDREDAQDIVQDTFVRLIETARRRDDLTVSVGWLFVAARRRCIDVARSRQRELARTRRLVGHLASTDDVSDDVISRVMLDLMLHGLPVAERRVLVLSAVADTAVPEIASALGRSPQAMSSLLWRSRRRVRRHKAQPVDQVDHRCHDDSSRSAPRGWP